MAATHSRRIYGQRKRLPLNTYLDAYNGFGIRAEAHQAASYGLSTAHLPGAFSAMSNESLFAAWPTTSASTSAIGLGLITVIPPTSRANVKYAVRLLWRNSRGYSGLRALAWTGSASSK